MGKKVKNQNKIKYSEELLRIIFDYSTDAYYLHDNEGNIIDINKALEILTGFKKKELIGQNFFKLKILPEPEHIKSKKRKISGKSTVPDEFTLIKKDKSKTTVSVKTYPLNINKTTATFGIIRAASDLKRTDKELSKDGNLLRTLIDNVPDAIWFKDPDSRFVICNKKTATDLGKKDTDEIIGKSDFELIPEDLAESLYREEQKILQTGKPLINKEIPSKDKKRWGLYTKIAIKDDKGNVIGLLGITRDIAKQKNAEIELQQYKEHLEKIVEARTRELEKTNIQLKTENLERQKIENELKHRITFEQLIKHLSTDFINLTPDEIDEGINKALKEIGEFLGADRSYVFLFHEDGTKMSNTNEWCAKGIVPQINRLKNLPPTILPWFFNKISNLEDIFIPEVKKLPMEASIEKEHFKEQDIKSVGTIPLVYFGKTLLGFFGIDSVKKKKVWSDEEIELLKIAGEFFASAIERKKNLENLRKSETILQLVLDNIPQRIFWKDKDCVYLGCNRRFSIDAGIKSPDEIIGKTDYDLPWKTEEADSFIEWDKKVMKSNTPEYHIIEPQSQADGRQAWLAINKIPLHDSNGNVIGILGTYSDITERFNSEQVLQESEEKYRNLIEQSNDAIYLLFDRKFVLINKKFEELFGVNLDEANSPEFDFINLVSPKSRGYIEERNKKINAGEKVEPRYEFTAIDKNGNEIEVETSVSYVKYGDGLSTQGILRDITDRKRAEIENKKIEERLFQAHKMESIGRLAGGIAHDFINSLTIIKGHTQLLEMKLKGLISEDDTTVEIIIKEIEKAKKLTRQLLDFAKKSEFHPEKLYINKIVKDTVSVMKKILKKNIDIDMKQDKKIKMIEGDKNQLNQVLTNIIINARDAMPDGGHLTIKTENINMNEKHQDKYPEIKKGDYVKISITDTGIGMTKKVKENIFEPFFTTKEHGKGSGLGLSAAYGIVKNHQGYIYCTSRRKKGTTFSIFLPAIK